ncbi:MAG: DEAD/DEAH box helicase, partial [Prevotellaceae bacterium]|nr:DEAD/DEAH box helicase [Prevotellaceae bacterium]
MSHALFVDVILPLALPKLLTYSVPHELQAAVGVRVAVQVGRKMYAAIVQRVHSEVPPYSTKPVVSILDNAPLVNEHQLELWSWISQYYLCSMGEVMKAALPAGLKAEDGYKPRYETLVSLHPDIKCEGDLNEFLVKTSRAPMQEKLLLAYALMAMPINFSSPFQVQKKLLLEKTQATDAVLKACVGKKIFTLVQHEVSRLDSNNANEVVEMPTLSAAQQKAFDEVKNHFADKQVALLHGVTSSGKTEIYMRLSEEAMAQGKQVLYMLPEIALTAQLINRLKKVFRSVGVYHSKFSDAQRVEVYQNLLKNAGAPTLILGVRSSLFLPFSNLGLVIVDEEHENTYKQQDPAPRYHARDTAIVMAAWHGAKVLL